MKELTITIKKEKFLLGGTDDYYYSIDTDSDYFTIFKGGRSDTLQELNFFLHNIDYLIKLHYGLESVKVNIEWVK